MSEPEKITITSDDLADPKVDEALAQQLSFGMAAPRDRVDDKPTGLLYRPWFVLMLAGTLGAFLAWCIIEPFFEDGVAFVGNVGEVDPSEVVSLGKDASVLGMAEVSGNTLWFVRGRKPVHKDGAAHGPDVLRRGDVVRVRGEPFTVPGTGSVVLVHEVEVLAADGVARPRVDLSALSRQNTLVAIAIFPVVAAFVGLFIGAADGLVSRAAYRAGICGLVGFGCGLGVGIVAEIFSLIAFAIGSGFVQQVDTGEFGKMSTAAFVLHMMVRGIAWAMAGVAAGLGQGIALRSTKLLVNGLLGGAAGSLLGGLLFDPIHYLLQGGDMFAGGAEPSRCVGFLLIGAATGFMIGVVELLAREAWCKMLTGPLAGKEFVLYRNPTVVGSSPKSDIFLFKDPEVEPKHALIHTVGEGYEIEDQGGGAGTWLNGNKVKRQRLSNGDQIRIGKTVLAFSMKEAE